MYFVLWQQDTVTDRNGQPKNFYQKCNTLESAQQTAYALKHINGWQEVHITKSIEPSEQEMEDMAEYYKEGA